MGIIPRNAAMSTRARFILILVFSLLAVTLGISSAARLFAAREAGRVFSQNAAMHMDRVDDIVQAYFTAGAGAAKTLAALPEASAGTLFRENGETDPAAETALLRRLEPLRAVVPGVEAAFCGYKNGVVVALPTGSGPPPGEDVRNRAWYSDAVLGTAPVSVTGAYISETAKSLAAVFSAGIKDASGETIGAAGVGVSLAPLADALRDMQMGMGGYLVIFDDRGRIILDPKAQENLLLPAGRSGDAALEAMSLLPAGAHPVTRDGTEYLAYARPLAAAQWKGVILMEAAAVSGTADSLSFKVALASLGILLAVSAPGLLATVRAARPLQALIRQSRALADGNTDALEGIPGRGPDVSIIHGNLGRLTGRIVLLQAEKERHEEARKAALHVDAGREEAALRDARREERRKTAETLRPVADDLAAAMEALCSVAADVTAQTETLLHAASEARDAHDAMERDAAALARQATETEKNADAFLARAMDLGAKREETARNLECARSTAFALAGNLETMKTDIAETGEVASSVRDMADQANLLAFNVSLDANSANGKAGDLPAVAERIRAIAENAMTVAGTAEAVTASLELRHAVQVQTLNKTLSALGRAVSGDSRTNRAVSNSLGDLSATIEQFRVLATALEGAAQTEGPDAERTDLLLGLSRGLAARLPELGDCLTLLRAFSTRLSASAERLRDEKPLD